MRLRVLIFLLLCFTNSVYSSDLHPKFEESFSLETFYDRWVRQGTYSRTSDLKSADQQAICARATFEVAPANLKIAYGLFQKPMTYKAILRFTEAKIFPAEYTPRGLRRMEVALLLPEGGRQDFALYTLPTSTISDAFVLATIYRAISWPSSIYFRSEIDAMTTAASAAKNQEAPLYMPYQEMVYWSQIPFLNGPDQAVKYRAVPCADNASEPLTGNQHPHNNELQRHLTSNEKPACFDFQLQPLVPQNMTDSNGWSFPAQKWVENASREWRESQAPFISAAKITLHRNGILPHDECANLNVNIYTNTLPAHRGLGSLYRSLKRADRVLNSPTRY